MPSICRSRSLAVIVGALFGAAASPAQETPAQPEAPTAIRYLERTVADRVEADGTFSRRERYRVQILTAGGLAQYSQVGVPFLEANQEAEVTTLKVTKPDGRELDLLASAPTDIAPVFPTDLPIYSDLRILRAAVPSLAVGDQLLFESTVRSTPIAPGQVWLEMEFAEPKSVDSQAYELDAPLDTRLTVSVRAALGAQFEEERNDGRWIRRWRISAGDHPTTRKDSGPAPVGETPDIQITTFSTWDEFGRWWSSLAPPTVDEQVRAKALELTRMHTEPKEQFRALHRYVAQEIRYLALPLGIGRFRAREPSVIMSTGLGDCKDKFRLLASLAESLGIAVDPVLIFASGKRTFVEEAPSPLQFDHVIARARLGSEDVWLDPTAEMVPMGSLPWTSRGRPGVALVRSGKKVKKGADGGIAVALLTTPAELPQPPSVHVEINGSIDAAGVLRAKVRWTVSGDDELYRLVYKYADDKIRRAALENLRREWNAESKVGSLTTSDPNDVDQPFWLEYEVERTKSPSIWRKTWEFWMPAPFTAIDTPPVATDEASGAPGPDRLEFRNTALQQVSARIEFPEGVRVSPPVPMSSKKEFAEFRSSYRVEDRELVVERELTFKAKAIERSAFDELRAFRRVIASDYEQDFDVAAAPALAPAERTAAELASDCWEASDAKRDEEAERLCRQAIALDPLQENVWNSLGVALEHQGRVDEAKAAYEKQIEVDPRHSYAYANLGLLTGAAGDLKAAEELFRRQVEVAPFSAFGYSKLGELLASGDRLDEAESLFRRAAKLEPEDVGVLEDLLHLEALRGRFEAVAEIVDEHPTLARDPIRLSSIFAGLTRQDPGDWSALRAWLQRLVADAEQVLGQVENLPPTRAQIASVATLAAAWEGLARSALAEGDTEEALALLDAAIGLAHSTSAIARRSTVLRARGDASAADLELAIAAELARPYAEDLERRLARAVPAREARQRLAAKAQEESWSFRSIRRKVSGAAGNQGEIWLLFGAEGRLRRATPVEASETGALAKALESAPLVLRLPVSNHALIPVKALAYCGEDGECTLTLEPPWQTWMSMKAET